MKIGFFLIAPEKFRALLNTLHRKQWGIAAALAWTVVIALLLFVARLAIFC